MCTADVYLNTKDAKDDEEGTAYQDDVADGLQRCDERLDYKLQSRSSADHPGGTEDGGWWGKKATNKPLKMQRKQLSSQPEGAQRPEQPENPEDSQDLGPTRHGHHDINEGHKDEEAIQDVPAAPEVGLLPQVETHRHHLEMWRGRFAPRESFQKKRERESAQNSKTSEICGTPAEFLLPAMINPHN